MELFNSSEFSSKNGATRDFQLENLSSKKILGKGTDPAWDEPTKVSSKNDWKIGDRCEVISFKKYSGEKGYVCGFHADDSSEFWVKLDSYDLQIRVTPAHMKFLEEKQSFQVGESTGTTDNDTCGNRSDDRIQPEAETMPKSKASDCWYTPDEIIALIQKCLQGITLDPCADDGKHVESCYHLTVADDGLSHPWFGRVFMNPPYSCPGVWIAKLQAEFGSGRVEEAIALVPVATDTKWFHPLISSNLICFWKGRIKFLDVNYQPKMAARQSHCLIYWGKNQSTFRQVFSPFGSFNLSEERGDRFIVTVDVADLFLEEKGAMSECNLHSLTSAQGSALDSAMQGSNSDSTSSEPQKLTFTALTSSASASQECITMEVSESFQDVQPEGLDICVQEESISSPLPLPAHHFPQKGSDLGQTTSATASPQFLQPLENYSPSSQSLKTSLVCSPAPIAQVMSEATSDIFWRSFIPAGMMRNGLLSEAVIVPLPLLEKESCWLPSPGALSSTGKGRPPGQTKQEGELKRLGALAPNQVINPEFLESSYNLPLGWTDPLLKKSALELLAEMDLLENAVQPLVTHSIRTLQKSHSIESSTSTQSLLTKFNGTETDPADFALDNPIPENFLEETEPQLRTVPKPKGRQRKGCLYKYIENKKLKDGTIASYPRVIGHRDPSNPTHWRWGFNWEEKIDGEWKGRSIGSVPIGAIALIQSMQKSGVPLEEIISFIKRSKSKK